MTAAITTPEGTHLAYTIYHESYWWQGIFKHAGKGALPDDGRPCVQVSASAKGQGGGVAWEFSVIEVDLGRQKALKLEIFGDSFAAFATLAPFFTELANVDTLDGVRELLDELGAVDETERADAERVSCEAGLLPRGGGPVARCTKSSGHAGKHKAAVGVTWTDPDDEEATP